MKKITRYIFAFLDKQIYTYCFLSILINPLFIIRFYLFRTLKKLFHEISGIVLDFGCGSSPYQSFIKVKKL